MTGKMEKKEEKKKAPEKNNNVKTENINSNASIEKGESKSKTEEQMEVKMIEGEEPRKLEFFSKDKLVEKIQKMEDNLKKKEEKLTQFQNQASDWKNKYTRLQAEFENTQKRWEKNRQNLRIEYTASVLKSFLPLYDSFKKALEHDDDNNKIIKGFYDQFMTILKSYKAEPIKPEINDPFDYNLHEALSSIERDDVPNNTIIEVVQDGWKLDKEVIRYAKVIISRKPKPPEPELEKEEEKEEKEEEKKKAPDKEKDKKETKEESSTEAEKKER